MVICKLGISDSPIGFDCCAELDGPMIFPWEKDALRKLVKIEELPWLLNSLIDLDIDLDDVAELGDDLLDDRDCE
jgi:hypothetical protein